MADTQSSRRHWFRFRLRTLLIFVTVVAVLLAWIGNARRQSKHELQVADELHRSDFVEVTIAGPFDSMERTARDIPQGWWRDLARRVLGERVSAVRIAKREFDDITPLARLTSLRRLNLSSTQVTDLGPLKDLKQLTYLDLRWAPVRDLTPLAGLENLEWLDLGFTPVADVAPLASLQQLKSLSLDSTPVTDVAPLAGLRSMQTLNLRATRLSDVSALAQLPKLIRLEVSLSSVFREQLDALQTALPNCKITPAASASP